MREYYNANIKLLQLLCMHEQVAIRKSNSNQKIFQVRCKTSQFSSLPIDTGIWGVTEQGPIENPQRKLQNLKTKENQLIQKKENQNIQSNTFEVVRQRQKSRIREQSIETHGEPSILSEDNKFREEVRHHLLSNTENHFNSAESYKAPDQMITNLEMTDIPKFGRIRSNVKTSRGVRVQTIRLRTSEAKESNHIFSVLNLFANDAGGNKLSRAGRIDDYRLL